MLVNLLLVCCCKSKNYFNLFLVLEEQNEELHAMVLNKGVEEGRHLLNGTSNSLAYELGEMNNREVINYIIFCINSLYTIRIERLKASF